MSSVTNYFLAFALLLISLQSCGGMETVVSVYPDGSAELAYNLEAPAGKLPDFEAMGKGQFSEIFKKDPLLSQESQMLIDSLVEFGVRPLLTRLKNTGQIRGYSISDSVEFTSKKVKIAIDLASYSEVGRTHSTFRREIPVLDSIVRKLTNRGASARPDSIAVVSLGDSLELQLHHFMIEPTFVETTREERITKANVMLDSMLKMFSDTTSLLAFFSRGELTKMIDSLKIVRLSMTDDQLDSMGQEMYQKSEMGDA